VTSVGSAARSATALQPPEAVPSAALATPRVLGPALALGGTILAGMALANGPLTLVGSLGALATAVLSPATGLAVLAFMAPVKSPAVIPAPGFNTLLIGAILLGSIYRLPIDRPTVRLSVPLVLLLAFTGYAALQQLPAFVAGYSTAESRHVGYLFIQLATLAAVALGASHVLRNRDPAPFLVAGIMGGAIAAALAIAVYALPPGSVANLVDRTDATSRVVGPFGDPNYFGLFQATAIAACFAAFPLARGRTRRLVLLATVTLLLVAFGITFSRGALLALAAGMAVLAFSRGRRVAILAAGLLSLLILAYPMFLELRLAADAGQASAQAFDALERSDASRVAAALAGPQLFLTSPVFGIGFGQYAALSGRFTGYPIESHNWYMNVLAEQGLIGVLLWAPMMIAIAVRLLRLPHAARSLGLAVFVTYAVGSIFLQPPLSVQTSAFAVIAMAAALVGDWNRRTKTQRHDDGQLVRQQRSGTSPQALLR
jgi:O-antigen ligase